MNGSTLTNPIPVIRYHQITETPTFLLQMGMNGIPQTYKINLINLEHTYFPKLSLGSRKELSTLHGLTDGLGCTMLNVLTVLFVTRA